MSKEKKAGGKFFKIAVIAGATVLVILGAISVFGFISYSEAQKLNKQMTETIEIDKIYKNIFINDIDISGLTKEEALKKINENFKPDYTDKKIEITDGRDTVLIKFSDLNPGYDFTQSVDEAYDYAREGSIKERYKKVTELETAPKKITYQPIYSYDDSKVEEMVKPLADKLYVKPEDASLSRKNGKFIVKPEKIGREMDLNDAVTKVKNLISENKGGKVDVVLKEARPSIKGTDFENAQSVIGTYKTQYKGSLSEARNVNISSASNKINDVVVAPGEVFSTNKAFGAMTYDNGYRSAPVIEAGKLIEGMGGGVCQVSSTLYNALLYSELPIVERQNHSLKVGYTNWGFDATLAGDYIDLKFKNDTKHPIFIESYLADNNVVVNVYGNEIHPKGRTLEFSNALVGTLAPGAEEIVEDPTLPKGKRVVEKPEKTGYQYDVYKTVYQDGKKVETVKVNTSKYRPVRAIVKVGTGENVSEDSGEDQNTESVDTTQQEADHIETPDLNANDNTLPFKPPSNAVETPPDKPIIEEPQDNTQPPDIDEPDFITVLPPDYQSSKKPIVPEL